MKTDTKSLVASRNPAKTASPGKLPAPQICGTDAQLRDAVVEVFAADMAAALLRDQTPLDSPSAVAAAFAAHGYAADTITHCGPPSASVCRGWHNPPARGGPSCSGAMTAPAAPGKRGGETETLTKRYLR